MPINEVETPTSSASPAAVELGQTSSMDIRSVVGVLLRHWKLIAAIPVLAFAATYGALKLVSPLYKSTVEMLIVDPKQQVEGAVTRPLSPFDVDNAAMSSEIAVIESRSLALRVVKELGLDKDKEFTSSRLEDIGEKLGLSRRSWFQALVRNENNSANEAADLDRATGALQKRVQVERVQFSYVLAISVTSEDPAKAERLARTYANDYLAEQVQARYDAAQRAAGWLTERLDDLRTRLLQTEASIQKLKAEGGLSDIGVGSNLSQQQTSDINAQLMAAHSEAGEKRARYEQAHHLVESGGNVQEIPEVMASGVIAQLRIQQSELSRREAELGSQYGERFPEVVATRSQLADISKAINAEIVRILGNMKNAYELAMRREQVLEASLQKLTSTRGDSAAYAKLRELEPQAETDRKAYESFLAQLNEITHRSALPDTGARIITPASVPEGPSSPRRTLIYGGVGVAAAALGFVLAVLLEYLDAGFKTGAQVEQAFGYHVIGMIPRVGPGRFRRNTPRDMILRYLINAPLSRLSESIRTTRIGLGFSSAGRVILVTSSIPNEGKSATAMLLAASSAISGQKTLLVDCDFHRKSVSNTFGERLQGLADVLTGDADISTVTIKDEATGIYVVPAGSGANNPSDLFTSNRMHDLFAWLRAQYECIVIDASPLLPVIDALALAPMADKILIAIEWNRTPRTGVVEALKVLRPQAHRIAGFVLTKVDFKRLRQYGYGYGSGYNYGRYYRALDSYYHRS
jgi:succinoglycan biosynthesis transport protein ExoP